MLKRVCFCCLLATSFLIPAVKASHLADNFDGSQVDSNLWQKYFGFSNSSLMETNGYVSIRNGAQLITLDSFSAPFEVRGRLRFSGSTYDNMLLVFRTTGLRHVDSIEITNGISIRFEPAGAQEAGAMTISAQRQTDSFVYAKTNRMVIKNQFYDFRLQDNGNDFSFFFGDLSAPILAGRDILTSGEKVAIYNHLAVPGPVATISDVQVDIDYLDIASPPPVSLNIFTAVELEFLTQAGTLYQLQASVDSQHWTNLAEQISGDGNWFRQLLSIRGSEWRFYRAEEIPSSDQLLIERAKAAPGIAQCIASSEASGLKIGASVNGAGKCPDGTEQKQVIIYGSPNCPPGQVCPDFTRIVAKITFDCSGGIVSAECL